MGTRELVIFVAVIAVAGCSGNQATDSSMASVEAGPILSESADAAPNEVETTAEPTVEVIVARVLEASPVGSGRCAQRSYRVEPVEARVAPFWIHFEHCEGEPTPTFDGVGLTIGETYRFQLRRGGSTNFGDEPVILHAEAP